MAALMRGFKIFRNHLSNGRTRRTQYRSQSGVVLYSTPGIATRKTSREKIVRKSLPAQPSSSVTRNAESRDANEKRNFRKTLPAQATISQDELRQYHYDQTKPTSHPLEEMAPLEDQTIFCDPQHRAVTPSDLDYGHIGAYKLGSLRITNGTVSPAPSGPEPSYFDTKSLDGEERRRG